MPPFVVIDTFEEGVHAEEAGKPRVCPYVDEDHISEWERGWDNRRRRRVREEAENSGASRSVKEVP